MNTENIVATYNDLKIRYNELKKINDKLELKERFALDVEVPEFPFPVDLLRDEQNIIGHYMHVLEQEATLANIELDKA